MIAFHARFDGKVIIPDDAVDLPENMQFLVHVEGIDENIGPSSSRETSALQWLAENAVEDDLPADLSGQADHYLYGTPKRD